MIEASERVSLRCVHMLSDRGRPYTCARRDCCAARKTKINRFQAMYDKPASGGFCFFHEIACKSRT